MMTEYRGAEHVLIITEDEVGAIDELDVLHPTNCPRRELMEGVEIHFCDIGAHLYEWGTDLYLESIANKPGMYLIQFWSTPPGWAGPVAIDADAGIDINELVIAEQ